MSTPEPAQRIRVYPELHPQMHAPHMRGGASGMTLTDSVFERLLRERIVFLGSQVDDEISNRLCAQLLLLAAEDPTRDVNLYINSPGGSVTAGMAIFDTMELIECDVATWAMGLAASMGQFLLSAGAKGKRYALPHSRILMHQGSAGLYGSASDIKIQAEQWNLTKQEMAVITAEHTGQTVEQIEKDADRDRWFTAKQALEYGFVDQIVTRVGQVAADVPISSDGASPSEPADESEASSDSSSDSKK